MMTFEMRLEKKDGETSYSGKNDGFSAFEILGFLEWKRQDIVKQITGEIIPDKVKREVVVEADKKDFDTEMLEVLKHIRNIMPNEIWVDSSKSMIDAVLSKHKEAEKP